MKRVALFCLLGAACFAGQNSRPVCNAANQGRLWPEQANESQETARRYFQSGELEMCSLDVWKFKWEHISVNVRELAKAKRLSADEKRNAR